MRSMLLIDLKAFLYGAVFDFLYIPIRVIEHAFASLSGRTDRYAVVSTLKSQ